LPRTRDANWMAFVEPCHVVSGPRRSTYIHESEIVHVFYHLNCFQIFWHLRTCGCSNSQPFCCLQQVEKSTTVNKRSLIYRLFMNPLTVFFGPLLKANHWKPRKVWSVFDISFAAQHLSSWHGASVWKVFGAGGRQLEHLDMPVFSDHWVAVTMIIL
jgi:hypothetical protein